MIPYLFLVHPGSALGSANLTLGAHAARGERAALTNEIARWDGHLIILSGAFDDEIRDYPVFHEAIEAAKKRGRDQGRIVQTRAAHDPAQSRVCVQIAKARGIPKDAPIVCTGAWASHGDSGCVNSVRDALKAAGYTNVTLSETAVYEDDGDDDENLEAA